MGSLILRSKTVRRKISDRQNLRKHIQQLSPLAHVIDTHKELSVKWLQRRILQIW